MATLTEEQKTLLILLGKPDDGSQPHVVEDGKRIIHELIQLGLVHHTGKGSDGKERFDFSDEGERIYCELTGEDMD